ncbi:MAG: LLM class flavin-dependent oxidoreductase [Acidimicrobiia bacterium]
MGAGYLKTEFFALGVDFDERNELFDECIDVMTQCWTGEPFSCAGKHFDARNVVHKPVPARRPSRSGSVGTRS